MKRIFSLIFLTLSFVYINAQTWTGAISSDWNTAGNWSPAIIPGGANNVIIPGTVASGNWPKFSGNVTINSIDLQPGSELDVNGFILNLNGNLSFIKFTGAILRNSNLSTDITINVNTGSGGFYTFFSSNTVDDHIVLNITGSNTFVEGYDGPSNHYKGNVNFNINDVLPVLISYFVPSDYDGNLTIFRTIAGGTSLFNSGANVEGNFSYNNQVGTGTSFGNLIKKTTIAGTILISMDYLTPAGFEMYQLQNSTAGGSIFVKNSMGLALKSDTLIVNELNISGYKTGQYGDMFSNRITGNVSISDDVSYGGGFITRIRNNEINGNTIFSINGTNTFLEADQPGSGNTYNGNVTFNAAGGSVFIAYSSAIQCSGNLSVIRTEAGHTQAFTSGGTIGGNFSYTNYSTGTTLFGNETTPTDITGNIDIKAINTAPGIFNLFGFSNHSGGGSISVQNSGGCNIRNNNLLIDESHFVGYNGATNNYFLANNITGNLTIGDDAGYVGGFYTYLRNNNIAGNTSISNNGTNILVDADLTGSGNKFMGNLTLIRNAGVLYLGIADFSEVMGNLTLQSNEGIVLSKLKFSGAGMAQLDQTGIQAITIANLIMQKTSMGSLTLNDSVSISSSATFLSGQIFTFTGKELVFLDNATCSGATEQSFVDGPVGKIGDDAFTFPLGRLNKFAPVSISAPAHRTDAYSAEYFSDNPHNNGYDVTKKDPTLHHISSAEYWLLNRTAGATNIVIALTWDLSRSGGLANLNDLRVAHWNGTSWKDEGKGAIIGDLSAGSIQSESEIASFSPFTLASATEWNPLPIGLISFTAVFQANKVILNWEVQNDIDLSHYMVERSFNGFYYQQLTTVPVKGGSVGNKYSMQDYSPSPGNNYYRLKMVGKDGSFSFSNVVKFEYSTETNLSVIPNPAKDFIIIKGGERYTQMKLTNAAGRLVKIVNGINCRRLDISDLKRGVYFLSLTDNEKVKTIKLVIE